MRILIADDSKIILDRLESILSENKGITIVGKAENTILAYKMLTETTPDMAILDIKMPGGDGISLLKKIKSEMPGIKVMMLTNYNQSIYRDACLAAGADYFLDKSSEFNRVIEICENEMRA